VCALLSFSKSTRDLGEWRTAALDNQPGSSATYEGYLLDLSSCSSFNFAHDHGGGECEGLTQFQDYDSVLEVHGVGRIMETGSGRYRFCSPCEEGLLS